MERIAGLVVLLSLWTLVAGQIEVRINVNERRLSAPTAGDESSGARSYIVHMVNSGTHGAMDSTQFSTPRSRYTQLLQSLRQVTTMDAEAGEPAALPVHVYSSVCTGFSARLTSQEAAALRAMDGVVGVYPDNVRSLYTTRTPEFLGLSATAGLWPAGQYGDDVIIGMLDGGVWPERESFSDAGLGPVPLRWKGSCQSGTGFNASLCNKKLIGARYYVAGFEAQGGLLNETEEPRSPRDMNGHGTHTASTAAGADVPNASLFGLANGTARGMAPKARIAVYKVCWNAGCVDSDIVAAFDDAVADGVDIISISVGESAGDYRADAIAVAAFGAMAKGVFVAAAGGNDGPGLQTVSNAAPWLMTVAASTLDRSFPASVVLGDGQVVPGQSYYGGTSLATVMITGAVAGAGNATASKYCLAGSLNPALVKGKIVVCERGENARVEKGIEVLAAGGAGMIIYNTAMTGGFGALFADPHVLPAVMVDYIGGSTILAYMSSTAAPAATLQFPGTQYNLKAPMAAGFSSRGPSVVTPQVLKPDLTAPGVQILAARTGAASPTNLVSDTRRANFNIISGTSMSCPHVSGLAALLKAAHRDWSPTAIKSALMTTADIRDNSGVDIIRDEATGGEANPFQFGSGHVRANQALDPGLVYDMGFQDYVNFLCALNYPPESIVMFTASNATPVTCPPVPVRIEDMNYPSFSAVFPQPPSPVSITMNMTRTVTNVGPANSTYTAAIERLFSNTVITVSPNVLSFSAVNENKSFTVQVTTVNAPSATQVGVSVTEFAYLVWRDGLGREVKSPIAITVYK